MTINFEEKLRYSDFSYDFIDGLTKSLTERIRSDEEVMAEIKTMAEAEYAEYEDARKNRTSRLQIFTLTLQDFINSIVDEAAENAVQRIKVYCEFDLEVSI